MKNPVKSVEWLAFPKEIKEKVIAAYEEHHKAVFSFSSDELYEAEKKCQKVDITIHKALGINTDFIPTDSTLQTFITDLKSSMKRAYNIFEVEEADPLMVKIINHMEKFNTIKSAAMIQAGLNIDKSISQKSIEK